MDKYVFRLAMLQVGGLTSRLVFFLASIFGSIKPFFTYYGRGPQYAPLGGARIWCQCQHSSPSGQGAEEERQLRGGRRCALSGHGEIEVLVGRCPGGTSGPTVPKIRERGLHPASAHLEFASLRGDSNGCAHRVSLVLNIQVSFPNGCIALHPQASYTGAVFPLSNI